MRNRWPYPYMEEGGLCYSKSINKSAKERILDYLKDSLEFLDRTEESDTERISNLKAEINVEEYLLLTDFYKKKVPQNLAKIEQLEKRLNTVGAHRKQIKEYILNDTFEYDTLVELPCFRRWFES